MSSTHQCLNVILLLIFSSSIYTTANHTITVPCLSDHYSALLQLKGSFLKSNLSSWQPGTDCCLWEGVTCDTTSGQVTALDLGGRDLQSHGLNPALFNLTSLRNLRLSGNDFMGALLPTIGFERLTDIILLNFSATNFVGQMPVGIARLNKLVILDFSYNNGLYLTKPSFQTLIANLSNLRELHLDEVDISSSGATWSAALADSVPQLQTLSLFHCSLSGSIHPSFSRLYSLVSIDLRYNSEITGEVPEFFANFSFLSTLSLLRNNFEGYFPIKIFQLKHLRTLDVSSNPVLSGHLPDFPSENHLEVLSLHRTNFSGDMPASIVNLKSLEVLGLRTVETPNESTSLIAKLPSLVSLSLSGSGAEKPMLSWIGSLKHLTDLKLYEYNLSGPIPSWIRNLTNLTDLRMIGCSLSGPIPLWIRNLTQLTLWNLDSNNLTGRFEPYLGPSKWPAHNGPEYIPDLELMKKGRGRCNSKCLHNDMDRAQANGRSVRVRWLSLQDETRAPLAMSLVTIAVYALN